jgi:hypothetical protein
VAVLFGLAAAVVLAMAWALTVKVGLPSWVVPGVGVLLALGFPIMMATGLAERRRAQARVHLTQTPMPEGGVRGLLTWKKALLGGGLAFGALALLAGGYMAMRVFGVGSVGTLLATGALESRSPLVLAEFANRTADSTLGPSVTDAFRVDLSQSPVIRLLDASAVSRGLQRMGRPAATPLDEALARELAQRLGAKAVITGEIGPVGKGYVLSTRIVAASGVQPRSIAGAHSINQRMDGFWQPTPTRSRGHPIYSPFWTICSSPNEPATVVVRGSSLVARNPIRAVGS